ncbi:hypothetical protein NLJ89_g12136 [Agrocybe chaxingu]|uniref:Uncharacterized protein n=1 Tax=Agrocybe chaxingu TaxID=84603 RepID=A0A9W8JMV9_9AGAR|nr:hypothetical protein NLJ89_g12136 [Agrocybe chaxingu]
MLGILALSERLGLFLRDEHILVRPTRLSIDDAYLQEVWCGSLRPLTEDVVEEEEDACPDIEVREVDQAFENGTDGV